MTRGMRVYAHRGFSGAYPENSMAAFSAALALGVDGIELDVHCTSDGVPVIMHDRDVARTTNGAGNVDELSFATVETLDAGGGERVPTLATVLGLVGNRAHLDIEVKGKGIAREVLSALDRFPDVHWALSSFDWETLRNFRSLNSSAELWPLAMEVNDDLMQIAAALDSPAVALFHDAYTAEHARVLREAGREVMIWTVNDGDEARRVRDLGASALCTDAPDHIMATLSIR